MTPSRDTIFALSSGRLPSGVAVVRLSGPRCRFVCETMVGPVPEPRQARLSAIKGPTGNLLDRGLVTWFEGPASFTGEDGLEFHLHGGTAVVAAVIHALEGLDGLRHAEPGEFTRRAFAHGKLDLTQAEALGDLISAETEAQRRLALLNADGRQGDLYRRWRERLIHARAMIEAELDFADEADVPGSVADQVWPDMEELGLEIGAHCGEFRRAEMIRDGFDVVIVGAPNAGKSSLLNALVKREAAIVTSEAGTTRDLIEVAMDLEGYRVRLTDTAGLRAAENLVERIGVERAMERAGKADLILELVDQTSGESIDLGDLAVPRIKVGSKADLTEGHDPSVDLSISVVDERGIGDLLARVLERARAASLDSTDLAPTRWRHVQLLREAQRHVEQACTGGSCGLELRAEELRLAGVSLGRITGDVDVEDLLDTIFSSFCIGK